MKMQALRKVHSALLCLALITFMLVLGGCSEEESTPQPRAVKLYRAQAPGMSFISLAAQIRPRYISELSFRVSGKLQEINVHAGQHVIAGQVLARMDTRDLEIALSISQATAEEANLARQNSEQRNQRYQALAEQRHISDLDMLDLAAEKEMLARRYEQARLEVQRRRADLSDAILTADFSGLVDAVYVERNEMVPSYKPVLRVLSGDHLEVEAEIPVSVVGKVRNDFDGRAHAQITIDGKQYGASLRELAASGGSAAGTYRARYVVKDLPEGAEIGRVVTLRLSYPRESGDRVVVPIEAVFATESGEAVWLYDEQTSTIERRKVAVQEVLPGGALIEGISVGAQLVAAGVHYLTDGQSVKSFE